MKVHSITNSEWELPPDFRQPLADAISNGNYVQE